MRKELKKAFTFKATIPEVENVYIPKIQSTYTPPKADFNEVFAGVHEQLKLKYDNRRN